MNCILDTRDEGIYDVNVMFTDDSTNVEFDSYKGCYDHFVHDKLVCNLNQSIPTKIYACDLYDNFIPRHYTGSCHTREDLLVGTGSHWKMIKIF